MIRAVCSACVPEPTPRWASGSGRPELGEEDVRELGVVVLARVHERRREPRPAGRLEHGRGLHEVGPGPGDDEKVGHRRASSSAFSHAAMAEPSREALLRIGAAARGELVRGREVERLSDRRGEGCRVGRRRDEARVERREQLRRGADRRPDHRRARRRAPRPSPSRTPRRRSSAARRGRRPGTSRPDGASSATAADEEDALGDAELGGEPRQLSGQRARAGHDERDVVAPEKRAARGGAGRSPCAARGGGRSGGPALDLEPEAAARGFPPVAGREALRVDEAGNRADAAAVELVVGEEQRAAEVAEDEDPVGRRDGLALEEAERSGASA